MNIRIKVKEISADKGGFVEVTAMNGRKYKVQDSADLEVGKVLTIAPTEVVVAAVVKIEKPPPLQRTDGYKKK